jgi:hypothetical protein
LKLKVRKLYARGGTKVLITLSFLLALLTAGCAASLPPSAEFPIDEEQLAIESAILAWHDAGLPWSSTCSDQYERIRVVVSKPTEFTDLCGRRPLHAGGKLYACNTEQYEHAFPFWVVRDSRVPLLVISELQPEDHRRLLVVHETMHWLERCSGKGIDFEHEDPRVWQDARLVAQRRVIQTIAREEERGLAINSNSKAARAARMRRAAENATR